MWQSGIIEIDDDLDIEEIIQTANENLHMNRGCVLERVKDTYGLEYEIKCGYCGTVISVLLMRWIEYDDYER